MTAATVNVNSDFTTTPEAPMYVVEFTTPSDDPTPTITLPTVSDGKTWRALGGLCGSTAVVVSISTNTATVIDGLVASTRGTLLLTKS